MAGRTRRAQRVPRSRPRSLAYAVPILALGLVLTSLAGCGQPAPASPDDSVVPTVSVPVQPTITAVTPSDDAADPSQAPTDGGLVDAASSLSKASCEPTGDSWSFTGTLTNSDTEEHTFTVAAFIMKLSDGSDVAGKELEVKLGPGASAPVEIRNFHTGPKAGVECLSGVTVKGL